MSLGGAGRWRRRRANGVGQGGVFHLSTAWRVSAAFTDLEGTWQGRPCLCLPLLSPTRNEGGSVREVEGGD
ncbi:hypothetical protein E2C01_002132 [Portunus trituberculatus]|uniref:Uncharacterized protein n=1 Tax=Portunus trituberculatus TaxID=210409 RepID=A0A5B7CK61_PORTR|nr:hypothetical protein [Portunus trituberculatus]